MSLCNAGLSTGPTNLMEWVQQQTVCLPGPSKPAAAEQKIASISEASVAAPPQESPAKLDPKLSFANAKSRVYDVATLYALRKEATLKNIELKVHTTALKGRQPVRSQCFFNFPFLFRVYKLTLCCSTYCTLTGHLLDRLVIFDDRI